MRIDKSAPRHSSLRGNPFYHTSHTVRFLAHLANFMLRTMGCLVLLVLFIGAVMALMWFVVVPLMGEWSLLVVVLAPFAFMIMYALWGDSE